MERWITTDWPTLGISLFSLVCVYVTVILLTRIFGLRSFAKMSAFDFAMTVAIGSLMASTATSPDKPVFQAIAVFAGLYFLQWLISKLRNRVGFVSKMIDNTPMLLMDGQQILDENLRSANLTRKDLLSKLREANVLNLSQVRAVVFETTGDISVLHSSDDTSLDSTLLEYVKRNA